MSRYLINCCKDCPERFPGCHSSCERYKAQRAEYDEKMAEHRKRYYIAQGLMQQKADCVYKVTKNRNKFKKGN